MPIKASSLSVQQPIPTSNPRFDLYVLSGQLQKLIDGPGTGMQILDVVIQMLFVARKID